MLFQMENHLQYSACSAKSPLKSEMVQLTLMADCRALGAQGVLAHI